MSYFECFTETIPRMMNLSFSSQIYCFLCQITVFSCTWIKMRKAQLMVSWSSFYIFTFLVTHKSVGLCPLSWFLRQGLYSGFQVTGMIEWGQKSKPQKIPGPKFNSQKTPMMNFRAIKISRGTMQPGYTRLLSQIFRLFWIPQKIAT